MTVDAKPFVTYGRVKTDSAAVNRTNRIRHGENDGHAPEKGLLGGELVGQ